MENGPLMAETGPFLMEEDFPDPTQLHKDGEWIEIRNPVSERIAHSGDWRIYPHLSNKETWKLKMGTRAYNLDSFLQRVGFHIDHCKVCEQAGAGRPSNWHTHIAAHTHFKEIGKLCCDGCDMDSIKQGWWESWRIPRGEIAFNYIDGQILMARGTPPPLIAPSLCAPGTAYALPGMGMPGPVPGVPAATIPTSLMPMSAPGLGRPTSHFLDLCPEAHKWFKYRNHVGIPTQKGGDYSACQWLQSKGNWKRAMQDPVTALQEILDHFQIYPNCRFCPSAGDFCGHLPAEKHFKNLTSCICPGQSIVTVAKQKENIVEWKVPGGAIRWYHITGMILVLRGEPSMASEEWHELHRPQLALPGAQAPQAPQAMPQPVQGVPAQPPTMNGGHQGQRQLTEGEFFWRNRCENAPETVAEMLTKFQVPAEDIGCSICGFALPDLDQFKRHLEGYDHFQQLIQKAGFPACPCADRERLKQNFNSATGARMTLDHFTLALQKAEA